MEARRNLGIDLGTSSSECCHVTKSGVTEPIPNLDGDIKTPSIVSYAGDTPVVGKAAIPDLVMSPEYVIKCGKRSMGHRTDQGKPIPIGRDAAGNEIDAVISSAAILSYLKESAETYLGGDIDHAVVTVPAYFDGAARADTKAAAKIAGLKVALIDEPQAAATYDGLEKGQDQILVVIDTGGGTTDVTAVEINGGIVETLLIDGDAELGGFNYDEGILGFMRSKGESQGIVISPEKDLATFYQNFDQAREAKEMLSRRDEITFAVQAEGKRVPIKLTRKGYRRIVKAFDSRFVKCCKRLQEAMKKKGKTPQRILLVGGNSRQPHIAEMAKEVFGMEPSRDTDPDMVVAKGASVYAQMHFGEKNSQIVVGGHRYLAQDIKMKTVAAHALCVPARKNTQDENEYNNAIVRAGTPLPFEFEERFSPLDPRQNQVKVKIVQGEPKALSKTATLLKEIEIPIQPSDKEESRILVKGRYTEEGLLELTVTDDLLGKPVSDSFIHSSGLSEEEIDKCRKMVK